jgi:hypothetical protein
MFRCMRMHSKWCSSYVASGGGKTKQDMVFDASSNLSAMIHDTGGSTNIRKTMLHQEYCIGLLVQINLASTPCPARRGALKHACCIIVSSVFGNFLILSSTQAGVGTLFKAQVSERNAARSGTDHQQQQEVSVLQGTVHFHLVIYEMFCHLSRFVSYDLHVLTHSTYVSKICSYVLLFGLCNFRVRTKHIPCVQNLKADSVDVIKKRLWKWSIK